MIHLTDEAQDQIIKLCREIYDLGIRLEVVSGGCSGYQYKFSRAGADKEDEDIDVIIGAAGAALFIDNESAAKIDGATIDYYTDFMFKGFEVHNPNSQCCGCGKSFS